MRVSLLLMHSPFLGPATWEPMAAVLRSRRAQVLVPSLAAVATSEPPYWPAGVEAVSRAAGRDAVVLVPHSNAGLFVPAIVGELGDQVRGVVFVDGALPGAGHHTNRDFLARLPVADGLLPRWTSWWPEDLVAAVLPDPARRAAVQAEQPRMPLAYYEHLPPVLPGWDERPCGYLWFGAPYDQGAEQAAARGWPTRHLPGSHLHQLADPEHVADAVLEMSAGWS